MGIKCGVKTATCSEAKQQHCVWYMAGTVRARLLQRARGRYPSVDCLGLDHRALSAVDLEKAVLIDGDKMAHFKRVAVLCLSATKSV